MGQNIAGIVIQPPQQHRVLCDKRLALKVVLSGQGHQCKARHDSEELVYSEAVSVRQACTAIGCHLRHCHRQPMPVAHIYGGIYNHRQHHRHNFTPKCRIAPHPTKTVTAPMAQKDINRHQQDEDHVVLVEQRRDKEQQGSPHRFPAASSLVVVHQKQNAAQEYQKAESKIKRICRNGNEIAISCNTGVEYQQQQGHQSNCARAEYPVDQIGKHQIAPH